MCDTQIEIDETVVPAKLDKRPEPRPSINRGVLPPTFLTHFVFFPQIFLSLKIFPPKISPLNFIFSKFSRNGSKRARIAVAKEVTQIGHPFVTFTYIRAHHERSQQLIRRCILARHTLDWTVIWTLGIEDEICCLLHTPPYSRVFIITRS